MNLKYPMHHENYDPEVSFVTVNNVNLAYRQLNSQGDKTILLLHGLAESSAFFWRPIFRNLSVDYRVIAFDLLGHGQSTSSAASYSPYFQAELVQSALQLLGINRVSIIAHSLGGAVGIAFALEYPKSVDKLVLYSVPISRGVPNTIPELLRELSIFSLLPAFPLLFPYSGTIMKLLPEALQKLGFKFIFWQWGVPYDLRKMTNPNFQIELISEAVKTSGIGLEKMVRNTFLFTKMIHRLPEISQPVLLIKGSRDFILSDRMANNYKQMIPNARLVVLPETSHISLLDKPSEFIEIVEKFLK